MSGGGLLGGGGILTTGSSLDPKELLWREYELHVGLYRHYLDLILKFNGFYHVAIGAFLSFYFIRSDLSMLRYAVGLPAIMSFVFAGVLFYGAILNNVSRRHIQNLTQKLGFEIWPEFRVLTVCLWASAVLLLLWTIGFVLLFFYSDGLVRSRRISSPCRYEGSATATCSPSGRPGRAPAPSPPPSTVISVRYGPC